jgi:hypothetical protein
VGVCGCVWCVRGYGLWVCVDVWCVCVVCECVWCVCGCVVCVGVVYVDVCDACLCVCVRACVWPFNKKKLQDCSY